MIRHHSTSQGYLRTVVVVCLFLLAASASFAQTPSFTVSYAHLTSLSIGDIDFKTFGSSNWFFTLNMVYPGTHRVVLNGQIGISLADGSIDDQNAATLVTKPFEINGQRSISNLDIGGSSDIKTDKFDFNKDIKDKLQNQALGTGKLPAGTYTFRMWITDADVPASQSEPQSFVLNLENISRLDLISPQDGAALTSPFPFFQWLYDGADVTISIYEMRPQDQSKEDALSGTPMLTISTGSAEFPTGSKTFQYPAAGVRPLTVGKSYVWQVKGATTGTGGVGATINSEIWGFSIVDPTSTTLFSNTTETSPTTITRVLYLLPGLSQDLINQLIAGNFTPTGVFLVDGVAVSAADVAAILNMLASNPDKVIDVSLIQ